MSSAAGKQPFQPSEVDAGRSYLNCDYCRQRHKKCLPASRSWPGPRCTNCEEADLPCGPPERKTAKRARTESFSVAGGQIGRSLPPPICPEQRHPTQQHPTQQHLLQENPHQQHPPTPHTPHYPRPQPPPQYPAPPTPTPTPYTPGHAHAYLPRNSFSSSSATLSSPLGPSVKSSLRDTQNLSTSSNGGDPEYLSSPPDGLVARLIHLGFLCILYEYWKGLETAASDPPVQTETGNAISSNIKQLAWCTAREAQCVLKTIIDLIEVEGKSTESQTLRYREALDTVEDVNKLGSKSEVFIELEVTILSKLILIYEQQEDAPTVRRFSLRRSKLKHPSSIISNPCHIAHTAQCWAETCGKLPELLESLELRIEAPLYANGIPRFPPQQSALRCGHSDIVDALCKLEGALQNLDMLKQNPVLAAAAVGNLSLLDTHLRNDKSLLKNRDLFQRTALFHTAYRGKLETMVTLVETGANVFDRDEAGQSILGIASAAGNADIVRWLLERGGVPSPDDHYFGSRSPLHDAARAGHTDVCAVLLEKGAYVDYAVDGVTAAQVARTNGFNALADMLDSALANPANRLFNASRTLVQANDIQASDVRVFNSYACPPSLLSFEVRSAQHAMESSSSPNLLRGSLSASFAAEDEAIDGQNLDHSIMMGESRELFSRREPHTQNQFSSL